ncbi:helix-turn-helix transcriptional regulator [Streptomyces mirabilis]|nr:helix-turn-helix transcriptional regulator [Streptomyces mirabilis]
MLRQPAFGHRLKKLRTAQGLSQTALAGEGMSTGYLSRLESGARQPTDRAVGYLAGRLGLDVADFEEPVTGSLAHALTLASSTGSADAIGALRAALAAEGHRARCCAGRRCGCWPGPPGCRATTPPNARTSTGWWRSATRWDRPSCGCAA